jgi:N-acetylmuramoyl-L-alanine amidase
VNTPTRLAVVALLAGLGFAPQQACAQDRPVAVIDAGHGGSQDGVVHEGWLEKDLVLEIALVVGAEFVRAGWDVAFTRTGDVDVEWSERRQRAEEAGAHLLIMLHAMGGDETERGSEIYFDADQPRSVALAGSIGRLMEGAGSPALLDPRAADFLSSEVATVMLEIAHMGNPVEARQLRSSVYQHELGALLVAAGKELLANERR